MNTQFILFNGLVMVVVSLFLFTEVNSIFAIEYANYTSEKYGIYFEYPSQKEVEEKTHRFDGTDIIISHGLHKIITPETNLGFNYLSYYIGIIYYQNVLEDLGTTDLKTFMSSPFKKLIEDESNQFKIIEKPTLVTIDNKTAGTYVYTKIYDPNHFSKWDKQDWLEGTKLAIQEWIIFNDDDGYLISFISTPEQFDKSEITEIREKFINSIKFIN